MREIIFRGKRTDNGEWVDGAVYKIPRSEGLTCMIFLDRSGWRKYAVDPETVGQYTGLKDKHGKMIFEGDILFDPHPSIEKKYTVIWFSGCFVRRTKNGHYLSLSVLNCEEFEKIGNIHDNPEMLEGD